MLQFFGNSGARTKWPSLHASTFDTSWIDLNVLAALGDCRAELEDRVAELTGQAELWEATVAGPLSGPDFTAEYDVAPLLSSLWQPFYENEIVGVIDAAQQSLGVPHLWCSDPSPWQPNPSCVATSGLSIVSGRCRHCSWSGGLVEQDVPAGCVAFVSIWCPICGSPTGSEAAYLISPLPDPLVLLAQVLIFEALSRCGNLLRLIVAAIAVLLSRLRAAAFRYAIATSQRNFFTHHGAHPPRVQPRRAPGLLPGRVFELQVAA